MVKAQGREVVPVGIPMEGGEHQAVIVIEREDELLGLGEAPVVPGRGSSLEALVAELRDGAPPRTPAVRCALETARLDLQARREAKPLAALLGGPRRRAVECCALVTATAPNLVAREVERKVAAGFSSFKLKAADGGGAFDQERLGAARWAAGPHASLRLDFNGTLTAGDAAARLPSLAFFRLHLVEQPLPPDAPLETWTWLLRGAGTALAADESLATPELAAALAASTVICAMKLATVGGPLAACQLAACSRGPVTIGSSFETGIGVAAALHVACALVVEPMPCGLDTRRLLDDDIVRGPLVEGSRLRLPAAPGLGVELDRRALDLYRLDR
jgi:L-alanine-DL-glutamate epimerase-like enolase superfamily enzyme